MSPVSKITPVGSNLCTLADVRALMQKKETDTGQDALIKSYIARASVAVMRFCDRQFAPVETAVTRVFEFPWESKLVSLAPYDLTKLTEVIIDTDQEPTTPGIVLSGEEYRLWPQPPRDGTYLSLRILPFSALLGRVQWPNRQVKVKGNWGFPEVPPDVIHATAATCVHWLTVNTAAFRRPDDDPNINAVPRRGIPPEAYDLLSRYKRAVTV